MMEEIIKKKSRKPYFKREGPRSHSNQEYILKPKTVVDCKTITYDFTFIPTNELPDYINYMRRWSKKQFGYYDNDLINDALLKVYRYANRYDETKASKKTWIIGILRNEILQMMKLKRKIGYLSIDKEYGDDKATLKEILSNTIADDSYESLPENYNYMLYVFNTMEGLDLLRTLVNEKLTYIELSNKLNIPIGTIKNRIYLQRKLLKQKIKYI